MQATLYFPNTMNNQQQLQHEDISQYNSTDCYDLIDKTATYKAAKQLMEQYKQKQKSKGKRHYSTGNTFDVLFAIIRSVAPTMEDIKKNQAGLFDECMENGEFFAFTTTETLRLMMNNLHQNKGLLVSPKTVRNQINRLIEIGIISHKVNYNNVGKRNPYPADQNPQGRGKIQLWISPDCLQIKPKYVIYQAVHDSDTPPFFDQLEETLPQYRTSSLLIKNKELKSIDNTANNVDKVAAAIAAPKSSTNTGKEQVNKGTTTVTSKIPPPILKKDHFYLQEMWKLVATSLYPGAAFNKEVSNTAKLLIQQLLDMAKDHVQHYRAEKIKAFQQSPHYIAARNQTAKFKKFCQSLPDMDQAAVEIFAHAIEKQRKYSHKYNQELYYPTAYLQSPAAFKALQYSIEDWDRIQSKYFQKNQTSAAYFSEVCWIQKVYSRTLKDVETIGYATANHHQEVANKYKRWQQELQSNPNINKIQQQKLTDDFIYKFKSIFNNGNSTNA